MSILMVPSKCFITSPEGVAMSTEAIHTEEQQREAIRENAATSQAAALASLVATVKQDSRQAAKAYLQETEVRHGGE